MKQKSKLSQNSLKPIILMSIEYRMKQSFYNLYSTLKIENLCEKAWQKSTINRKKKSGRNPWKESICVRLRMFKTVNYDSKFLVIASSLGHTAIFT